MTQRALIIAALAKGPGTIVGALDCDDTRHLSGILRRLGTQISWQQGRVHIHPRPLSSAGSRLYCGNAGTALRFAGCLALVSQGRELWLDGDARLRQRPIGGLVDGLQQLGARAAYRGRPGYPPVALVRGRTTASSVRLDLSLSSQHASGLLLVAPLLPAGLRLCWAGRAVSRPYIDMTIAMMRRAGAAVRRADASCVLVMPSEYRAERIEIEPDWSAAAFLLAAGWLVHQEVSIPGLVEPGSSIQGDAVFTELLRKLQKPHSRRFDLTDSPDLIAVVAVAALFAGGPTAIVGVAHARTKESDRVRVLCQELRKVGARLEEHDDGLDIHPLPAIPRGSVMLDPAMDHRMAMAFGLLSLRLPNIEIKDPDCVSKSFPGYWTELERIRAAAQEVDLGR